ncbi:alpha/beta fold hydrolase [Caulobacter segnis]|uniref:Alpha/beta hydrolase n=1 Tax=Caulobacter segnis TaxID=88688 RepID=A0A2W5VA39_9CAUL|nr:alpha/beta fold hydrolase [Caulobacter segnis]PZR36102.1 MAG: alpha/beta hydrolase [Caulobacter segnis]
MIDRRCLLAGAVSLVAAPALAASLQTLTTEDGRQVQVSVWKASGRPRGLILFSHGALSAPGKYENLLEPWRASGFDIAAPLHVDSTDHPDRAKYGMADSWKARLLDMRALAKAFAGGKPYVAAGHSYGALVALTLGGVAAERPTGFDGSMSDAAVKAVVAFSPPGVTPGLVSADGFKTLARPALVQTGTMDVPPGAPDWRVHLAAFENAPAGDKYGLVLNGVDHYFGHLICRPERDVPAQSDGLKRGVEVSSLFLAAYGAGDRKAMRALASNIGKDAIGELTLR